MKRSKKKPVPFDIFFKIVAQEIKRAREDEGLSIAEVAKSIGVSLTYMYMIESGQRRPSLMTLMKLSKALSQELSIKFV